MEKLKMIIVSTTGFPRREGISTIILDYLSRFDKTKFCFDVIVPGKYDQTLIQEFKDEGFLIQYVPSRKENPLKYYWSFFKKCNFNKYNILYIHGCSAIVAFELLIAKLCGCGVRVVHSHNTTCRHLNLDKLCRPAFYKLYTCAIACSRAAGTWLYGNRPFHVIKNGRDVDHYRYDFEKRRQVRTILGLKDDELAIGHVGNFNTFKNHAFIVNVFKCMLNHRSNATLYFIGDGELVPVIKKQVTELGLQDKVVFMGSVRNVNEILQGLDVMILPSLHEGLPLVTVEWQIAALPCLVSDQVTKECVFTSLVYYMSLEVSEDDWARKLIEISNVDRERISKEAAEAAKQNGFDIKRNAYDLECLFTELLNK